VVGASDRVRMLVVWAELDLQSSGLSWVGLDVHLWLYAPGNVNYFASGRWAKYCYQRVCLYVCPLAYLQNHMSKFNQLFSLVNVARAELK